MNTLPLVSIFKFAAAGLTLLAAGCASTHRFNVDALARPEDPSSRRAPSSYHLVAAGTNDATPPAQRLAALRAVRTALSSKGMFEAPAGVAPELEIEYGFGLTGPHLVTRTSSAPVYWTREVVDPTGGGGVVGVSSELQGVEVTPRQVRVYRKFLRLTARPARAGDNDRPAPQLWTVRVENEDESDNLGKYVVLMAAAAMDEIGRDTQTRRTVTLTGRDGRVLFIHAGIP